MKQKKKQQQTAAERQRKLPLEKKGRNHVIYLFVAVLISFIAFYPALQNGFVNLDDDRYVLNNPVLHSINPGIFFSEFKEGNYHPLTMLTYAVSYRLFGLNPAGYHAVNMLLHLLNVVLVFFVILALVNRKEVALVTSLLFGIHPMHTESVAWVSELKDLLYTFFFLASWLFYLKFLKNSEKKFYFFSLLLFLLSLFSKAMAVSLPVVLLLTDYFRGRKLHGKAWLEKTPFFILSIIFGIIAIYAQRSGGAIQDLDFYPFMERMAFAGYGFITYLIKLVLPFELSAYYPYPVKSGTGIPGWYYIYPVMAIILAALVFYSLRVSRKIFFGFAFFAVTVFLVLQLLPVGNTIMADRYSYIPSIGIFFLAGEGLYALWHRKIRSFNPRVPVLIFLGALVIIFSVMTQKRCGIWKNSLTLWNDVIGKYQTIPVAYNNRGMVLEAENRIDEALEDYNSALKLQPDFAMVYNNRGNILMNRQKFEEAMKDYTKAIELQPGFAQPYNGRGVLLMRQRKFDSAVADYLKAIEFKPDYPEAYYNMAICESNLGRKDNACSSLQKAISLGMQQAGELFNQICR